MSEKWIVEVRQEQEGVWHRIVGCEDASTAFVALDAMQNLLRYLHLGEGNFESRAREKKGVR